MTTRRGGAPAVLLAALLLAGCAGSSSTVSGPTSPDPTAPGPTLASPADDPVPGAGGKPGAKGTQTLTGTISAGVEPRCLMLNGVDGVHQLIIADDALRGAAKAGASVTVVGRADPRMMTTCQQGTPFVVTQLRAN